MKGLVYVDLVSTESNKYKLIEHFGNLDITEYYGELLAKNAEKALDGATSASYANGVITTVGEDPVTLASPSVLQEAGITGIEAWT